MSGFADLTIRTTITPNRGGEVPISFGYHPYLRPPGAPREDWEIELPVRERLVLDERMIPTGRYPRGGLPEEPLGDRSFDDAFAELVPGGSFVATGGGRRLAVDFVEGYPYAQVYSPPGAGFICFEPMTAPTNALCGEAAPAVGPADVFSAAFRIRVSPVG